jgi:hypothetical protein
MKKQLLLGLVGLLGAGLLVAGLYHGRSYDRITSGRITVHTFGKIDYGMTFAEVEQLIGLPPGRYTPGTPQYGAGTVMVISGVMNYKRTVTWEGKHGKIDVHLDHSDRVWNLQFHEAPKESQPSFDSWAGEIRRWFHRD